MRYDPLDREHFRKIFDIVEVDKYGVTKVFRWNSTWAHALSIYDPFQTARVSAYQRLTMAAIMSFETECARWSLD